MASRQSQTAWFVGDGSLLIQAAEIWLSLGHRLEGVATRTAAIETWAREHGVARIDPSSLTAELSKEPFDYLFSIVNLTMLDEALLTLPRKLAINFHDGPLPRYAGVNATVWALLADEKAHGITFHEMTREADAGRILAQKSFEVSADETAFSLNAKCFTAGIDTFRELAERITDDTLAPLAQDLSRRTYFGFYERPAGAQCVSFDQPAAEIERLVRALDFGAYPNPVGVPKIAHSSGPILIGQATVLESGSSAAPGTIVDATTNGLTVATKTTDVLLSGLRDDRGETVDAARLGSRGVVVGAVLSGPDEETTKTLTAAYDSAVRHEGHFVRILSSPSSPDLRLGEADAASDSDIQFAVSVPDGVAAERLAALALAFVSRYSGESTFDAAYADPALRERTQGTLGIFAAAIPLRLRLESAGVTVESALEALDAERKKASARFPFSRDLFARQPDARRNALSLAVLVDVDWQEDSLADPAIRLCIDTTNKTVTLGAPAARVNARRLESLAQRMSLFFDRATQNREANLSSIALLSDEEVRRLTEDFNATARHVDEACLHQLFEAQVARTPEATAVTSRGRSLTYRELNQRANALAHALYARGVSPDTLVGVYLERSTELLVAVLGIQKAGGAYVPLDPEYPPDRIQFMIEDAQLAYLVTDRASVGTVPPGAFDTVVVDEGEFESGPDEAPNSGVTPRNLAYVIYTSGSTGKPKGVMIEHQSAVNFIAGMDEVFEASGGGTWLAVTSLSFDISVLELFGSLAHGMHVVIASSDTSTAPRAMEFSLFYFSANSSGGGPEHYRLLLEGARFADENGFVAVWTPERHFHRFGGLYPNPAVVGAAIAATTTRISIRAGSCVSPLHAPPRIAEEWSLVDNLSNGRVGISFASGWQPNDFVLRPDTFKDRKGQMFRDIETVRRLWRGETIEFENGNGKTVAIGTLPRPVQKELPVWVTAAGSPETFEAAGRVGANLLTHLLGQTFDDIAEKTRIYREARKQAGHRGNGTVTLMLHTFVGTDEGAIKDAVRAPMKEYLRTAMDLVREAAWSFPTFKEKSMTADGAFAPDKLTAEEHDAVLEHAFERYYETSGFFGNEQTALRIVDKARAAGVDEIACLIDFGVPTEDVLASLPYLAEILKKASPTRPRAQREPLSDLFTKHAVTHLQCTPSMASMLLLDDATRAHLENLTTMLVGGEALPPALARDLEQAVPGKLLNMYGPTETTVWSSYHRVKNPGDEIPIGRPIANTDILILDHGGGVLPPGEEGELGIGGSGLSRGYLGQKELTEARFVPHPFRPGERIYRTGDLALFDDDGVLHFRGRFDNQVKLRGYRIELGEIEARLGEHPSVLQCAVIVREDSPGDKRLVAYLVPKQASADEHELREYLAARLPEYMVPSTFVVLRSLPQTPNKKIDRKALPRPNASGENGDGVRTSRGKAAATRAPGPKQAPAEGLERTIAGIWTELLGRSEVSVDDNFFDLGGHSLLTIQVLGRLKPQVDRPVSLVDLFRYPTIRSLSNFLQASAAKPDATLDESAARGAERQRIRRAMMDRRRG